MFNRLISWIKRIFKKPAPLPVPVPPVWSEVPVNDKTAPEMLYDMAHRIMERVVTEVPGQSNNPLIVEMHKVVSGTGHPDETPWCAAFVGYVLDQCGFSHTNSLVARSYLDYGRPVSLDSVQRGDIIVFKRGNSTWQGHVAFYHSHDSSYISVLGGNQSNAVNIKKYSMTDFLGARTVLIEDQEQNLVKPQWSEKDYAQRASIIIKESDLVDLVPTDIANYFPNYKSANTLNRQSFWEFFLSCMAMKESGLKPETKYTENFPDSKGKMVISRGLFQLSVESVNGYKKYGIEMTATDKLLHDPFYNLQAAIVILKRWIKADGSISSSYPWRGGARYWSVLRTNSNHEYIKTKCLEAFRDS